MSRGILFVSLLITACDNKAINNAKQLDPNTRCVSRSDDMAYCIIKGEPFICDDDFCLPAKCAAAAFPEVEAGDGSKNDR